VVAGGTDDLAAEGQHFPSAALAQAGHSRGF
jgi:hypothetical protein